MDLLQKVAEFGIRRMFPPQLGQSLGDSRSLGRWARDELTDRYAIPGDDHGFAVLGGVEQRVSGHTSVEAINLMWSGYVGRVPLGIHTMGWDGRIWGCEDV